MGRRRGTAEHNRLSNATQHNTIVTTTISGTDRLSSLALEVFGAQLVFSVSAPQSQALDLTQAGLVTLLIRRPLMTFCSLNGH